MEFILTNLAEAYHYRSLRYLQPQKINATLLPTSRKRFQPHVGRARPDQ